MSKQRNKHKASSEYSSRWLETLDTITNIIIIPILVLSVICSIVMINAKRSNSVPNIFGYSLVTILSDSMQNSGFEVSDTVMVKSTEVQDIKVGDIIAYYRYIETHKDVKSAALAEETKVHANVAEAGLFNEKTLYSSVESWKLYLNKKLSGLSYTATQASERAVRANSTIIFHQVVDIVEYQNAIWYKTWGTSNVDANGNPQYDSYWIKSDYVIGVYTNTSFVVREFLGFASTNTGIIWMVEVPSGVQLILSTLELIEIIDMMGRQKRDAIKRGTYVDSETRRKLLKERKALLASGNIDVETYRRMYPPYQNHDIKNDDRNKLKTSITANGPPGGENASGDYSTKAVKVMPWNQRNGPPYDSGGGGPAPYSDSGGGGPAYYSDSGGGGPAYYSDSGGGGPAYYTDSGGGGPAYYTDSGGGGPAKFSDSGGGGPAYYADSGGGGPAKFSDSGGGGPAYYTDSGGGGPAKFSDSGGGGPAYYSDSGGGGPAKKPKNSFGKQTSQTFSAIDEESRNKLLLSRPKQVINEQEDEDDIKLLAKLVNAIKVKLSKVANRFAITLGLNEVLLNQAELNELEDMYNWVGTCFVSKARISKKGHIVDPSKRNRIFLIDKRNHKQYSLEPLGTIYSVSCGLITSDKGLFKAIVRDEGVLFERIEINSKYSVVKTMQDTFGNVYIGVTNGPDKEEVSTTSDGKTVSISGKNALLALGTDNRLYFITMDGSFNLNKGRITDLKVMDKDGSLVAVVPDGNTKLVRFKDSYSKYGFVYYDGNYLCLNYGYKYFNVQTKVTYELPVNAWQISDINLAVALADGNLYKIRAGDLVNAYECGMDINAIKDKQLLLRDVGSVQLKGKNLEFTSIDGVSRLIVPLSEEFLQRAKLKLDRLE